jgi:formylglycine-generating enzyme required for sulfatase activity
MADELTQAPDTPASPCHPDMAWIPGGAFRMGFEDFYPEEQPVHEVSVDGFWIDRYEVTSAQFLRRSFYGSEYGLRLVQSVSNVWR